MAQSFDICICTASLLLPPVMPSAIDLSKATKLRDVVFRPTLLSVGWITTAFQTNILKHRELRKISIYVPRFLNFFAVDTIKKSEEYEEWLDLDRLLVQFLESRSTLPNAICMRWEGANLDMRDFAECFLPELSRRGMIDLV